MRDNGGAVCVNFGPEFLDADWNARWKAATDAAGIGALVKEGPSFYPGEPSREYALYQRKL